MPEESKDYIHKKIAALELIKYLKRDNVLAIVSICVLIVMAAIPFTLYYIRIGVALIMIIFLGITLIKDVQYKNYLNNQYFMNTPSIKEVGINERK